MKASNFVRFFMVLSTLTVTTVWGADTQSSDMQTMQRQWTKTKALNQLHHINQMEIQMAKMAQDSAQSSELKNFAKQMNTDHSNLENRVTSAAQASNIELQKFQPSTYEQATMDSLKSLKGGQFDQMFTWTMVRGHEDAMADLKRTSASAQDPQVKTLIQEAMPRIRQHWEMARSMSQSISRGVASDQNKKMQKKSEQESQ